jgi:hypothetical protein
MDDAVLLFDERIDVLDKTAAPCNEGRKERPGDFCCELFLPCRLREERQKQAPKKIDGTKDLKRSARDDS